MSPATQEHPFDLFLKDLPDARDHLHAEDAGGLKAFTSVFTGALGEIVARDVLGVEHASHEKNEYDLESKTLRIEVKTTRLEAIKNVNLEGKNCDLVAFVRLKQRGKQVWVEQVVTRARGDGPGQKLPETEHLGVNAPRKPYRVL